MRGTTDTKEFKAGTRESNLRLIQLNKKLDAHKEEIKRLNDLLGLQHIEKKNYENHYKKNLL